MFDHVKPKALRVGGCSRFGRSCDALAGLKQFQESGTTETEIHLYFGSSDEFEDYLRSAYLVLMEGFDQVFAEVRVVKVEVSPERL